MLKTKHFENTEIHTYLDDRGLLIVSSAEAIELLNREAVDGIYNMGILHASRRPELIINFYHIDKINPKIVYPTPHHVGSFKQIKTGYTGWELICEHEIIIHYPDISVIKLFHTLGNHKVRQFIMDFVKKNKYWDIKKLDFADATWLMANMLGAAE